MNSPELISICAAAFLGVFLLLTVLAVIMRLIIVVFPERETKADAAILAAVATTYEMHYPGTTITRVEEEK